MGAIAAHNSNTLTCTKDQLDFIGYDERSKYGLIYVTDSQVEPIFSQMPPIKVSTCTRCGAALPLYAVQSEGIVQCQYCDTFTYVW